MISNASKSSLVSTRSLVNTARVMCDLGLPTRCSQCRICWSFSRGPCAAPTTVPRGVFFTHPTRPSSVACACVNLRKKTFCTVPNTSNSKPASASAPVPDAPATAAAAAVAAAARTGAVISSTPCREGATDSLVTIGGTSTTRAAAVTSRTAAARRRRIRAPPAPVPAPVGASDAAGMCATTTSQRRISNQRFTRRCPWQRTQLPSLSPCPAFPRHDPQPPHVCAHAA
jgi:hypothetical protein